MAEEENAVASIIRTMNEEGGNQPTETPPTPAEPPATPPPAEPAQQTPKPAAQAPKKEDGSEYTPPEPSFIKKDESAPAAPATPEPAVNDEVFYSRLSEVTEGSVKTQDDLVRLITDYNELVEQSQKGFEPKFPDERAKWAYQLLTQNQGKEPEAAMRTLRALSFDTKGKSEKEVLFEGYLLDPNNADLAPAKALQYFEAEFEEKYSLLGKDDAELTPEQQRQKLNQERQLANSVRETKGSFEKLQTEFKATEEEPRQVSEKVVSSINSAVDKFGGIKMTWAENPTDLDFLQIPIEDQQELQAIKQDALNPNEWYNQFIGQFDLSTQQGYDEFIQEFYMMRNHKKIAQLAYDHGYRLGDLARVNKLKNATQPADIAKGAASPPASPAEKSFMDTWADAKR